jgi:hypothetical protein
MDVCQGVAMDSVKFHQVMLYLSTPCGRTTTKTVLQPLGCDRKKIDTYVRMYGQTEWTSICDEERDSAPLGPMPKRRVGTKKEDRHEGLYQISDQFVHKRLRTRMGKPLLTGACITLHSTLCTLHLTLVTFFYFADFFLLWQLLATFFTRVTFSFTMRLFFIFWRLLLTMATF